MAQTYTTLSPYSPVVGAPPPYLAGREELFLELKLSLDRLKAGLPNQSLMVYGVRGIGKTAALNEMHENVNQHPNGPLTIALEVGADKQIIDELLNAINDAIFKRDKLLNFKRNLASAFSTGKNFLKWKASGDKPGEESLVRKFSKLGEELQAKQMGFIFFIDEFQILKKRELEELLAIVNLAQSRSLPFLFVIAGLLNLPSVVFKARSNAERMFDMHKLAWLPREQARLALQLPAEHNGRSFCSDAMELILDYSKGYPFFLQIWGSQTWRIARGEQITVDDVHKSLPAVREKVESFTMESRLDKVSVSQLEFLLALAELAPQDRTSANVTAALGGEATSISKVRLALIKKGLIHTPAAGKLEFTLPMFDEIVRKNMDASG